MYASLTSASKMAAHSAAETALLARMLALERIVNTGGTGTITFVDYPNVRGLRSKPPEFPAGGADNDDTPELTSVPQGPGDQPSPVLRRACRHM